VRPLGHPLPHPRTALPLIDFSRYIALLCAVHECTAVALCCCCCCCSCFSLLLWLLFLFLHDQVPHGDKSWTDANPEPRPVRTAVLPSWPPHAPPFPHMNWQSDANLVNHSSIHTHQHSSNQISTLIVILSLLRLTGLGPARISGSSRGKHRPLGTQHPSTPTRNG